MELLKLLSTSEIVAQLISFLILFFILKKFAWKPILKILDDRKAKIAADFKKIEDTKSEVSKLKADYEKQLSVIEDTSRIKLQEAIKEGSKLADEIKKKAQEEAQRIIDTAKDSIKYEVEQAKKELKEKIVDLTIEVTEKIIKEKLTEEKDKKLINDFISNMSEAE